MQKEYHNENRGFLRKAFVPAAMLGLLLALFYYKDFVLDFFNEKKAASVAEVSVYKNDVRKKDAKSIDFRSAKENEKLYHGDSLSTGNRSSALVTFKTGQILNVDQNSLIIFDEETDTPEFVKGNIKLSIKGKMKLKVDNEIIEITGQQSDIQIYKDEKNKGQRIVLLKGAAQVRTAKKEPVILRQNIPMQTVKTIFKADQMKNPRGPSAIKEPTVVMAQAPAPQSGHYKLYDYYSRMLSSNTDLGRNRGFMNKPNFSFLPYRPAGLNYSNLASDDDPKKNPYRFRITDPDGAAGYVIEVSPKQNFPDTETLYAWKSSDFSYNFDHSGTYFMRYRKVLDGQALSDYSPTEMVNVAQKIPKPVIVEAPPPPPPPPEPPQRVIAPKPIVVEKPKPIVVPKPIVIEKPKPAPVPKPVVIERKVAAVEPTQPQVMQSNAKAAGDEIQRNQDYRYSTVALTAGQSSMVSGQQLANSNQINTGYNLEVNATHWINQHGFQAAYNQIVTSQNSTNLVTTIELNYLYRFNQSWNFLNYGSFQYYGLGGFEMHQNGKSTADYIDSYNLYKLGVGASMPIFSFWSLDAHFALGFGDAKKSSIQFGARANYFIRKDLSLGVGFRARKFEYYLLDEKNYESLAETYATVNMYY